MKENKFKHIALNNKIRAILGVALIFCSNSFAEKAVRTETYKEIIEKSYNLSLQKDRLQAQNILFSALKKEKQKSIAETELKKTINEISTVFYSDKAQQQYELGLSLIRSDSNLAIAKFQESLRLEPENILPLLQLARTQIGKGDCKSAQDTISKFIRFKEVSEQFLLVQSEIHLCLKDFKKYLETKVQSVEFKPLTLLKIWKSLEIDYQFRQSLLPKDLIEELNKIDPEYPEVSYWRIKMASDKQKAMLSYGKKYLTTCKNLSSKTLRQYMMDSNLCSLSRVQEVESIN